MQVQRLIPLVAIGAGVVIRWLGGPAWEALAWIFVAGGLAGALLELLLSRRSASRINTGHALPSAVMLSEPETWSANVSLLAADALVDAGLVEPREKERAAEIVGEELAVRLGVGDYPAHKGSVAESRPGA